MSINGNITGRVSVTHTKNNPDPLGNPTEVISTTNSKAWTTTTEPSGQVFHDQNTLTAGNIQSYVLIGGALQDEFGLNVDWDTMIGFYLEADADNTGTIQVSGGLSSVFNDLPTMAAGEGCVFTNSSILSTGNNTIYILNNDGLSGNTYDLVMIGR